MFWSITFEPLIQKSKLVPFLESTGYFLSYKIQILSSLYIGKGVNFDPGGKLISYTFKYLMLETKQSLNFLKKLPIFHRYLCSLIKIIYDHKKTCVAAKILVNLRGFFVFLGSPLNFDKEKWYYTYNEQFLKNDF